MFKLCGAVEAVNLDAFILRLHRFGVEEIELEFCAELDFIAHALGAFDLRDQRLTRIEWDRLMVHALETAHGHRDARFPRKRDWLRDRE